MNISKIKIFFSKNIPSNLATIIERNNGFTRSNDFEKYLGVSLLHQRITKKNLNLFNRENAKKKNDSIKV